MIPGRCVVSDAGPIISLEKLEGGFDFIRLLYDQVLLPQVVLEELATGWQLSATGYLNKFAIEDLIDARVWVPENLMPGAERLHTGEIAALDMALQFQLPILIEETIGRQIGVELGLQVSGIVGQLVKAVRLKLTSRAQARVYLRGLLQAGRVNRKIFRAVDPVLAGQ